MNPDTQPELDPKRDTGLNPPRPVNDVEVSTERPALDTTGGITQSPAQLQNAPAPNPATKSQQPLNANPAITEFKNSRPNVPVTTSPLTPKPGQASAGSGPMSAVPTSPMPKPALGPIAPEQHDNYPKPPLSAQSVSAATLAPQVDNPQNHNAADNSPRRPFSTRPLPPLHDEPEATVPQPSRFSRLENFVGSSLKTVVGIIIFLVLVFGGAALLNSFVFQSYYVDGESMQPTLSNNDRLIINKFSLTKAAVNNKLYIPERGDIVVLDETSTEFTATQNEQLIKRVIGLPGERVKIADGQVQIFNDINPLGFNPDVQLNLNLDPTYSEQTIEITLKNNQIFVMGDNRSQGGSYDSRAFGAVETEHIVGTLAVRILPLNKIDVF